MGDNVNHPKHYADSGLPVEVIEIIDPMVDAYTGTGTSYYMGNVIKYVLRAPFKGTMLEDLRKAAWYLNRAIERIERGAHAKQDTINFNYGETYVLGEPIKRYEFKTLEAAKAQAQSYNRDHHVVNLVHNPQTNEYIVFVYKKEKA